MAFMGIMFGMIFIILLIIHIFLMLTFFILAAVLKIIGRKKEKKKLKIAGNVFLVLGIIFAVPLIAMIVYLGFHTIFTEVTLPDGETKYVRTRYISAMYSYVEDPDESSINALEKLLDKNSSLVFYKDSNRESILDAGLKIGNADIVKIALEHGAIFDDPKTYEFRSGYLANSMECYLEDCIGRRITEDDIEIVEIMFENKASTEFRSTGYYSNMFGKAAWAVLYNDETVTDIELEFIQIFIDNRLSSDTELLLMEEATSNYYYFSSEYCGNVARDSNYNKLMDIIGK